MFALSPQIPTREVSHKSYISSHVYRVDIFNLFVCIVFYSSYIFLFVLASTKPLRPGVVYLHSHTEWSPLARRSQASV